FIALKHFTVSLNLASVNSVFRYQYKTTADPIIADWGDGAVNSLPPVTWGVINGVRAYSNGSATTGTARFFHNDNLLAFNWQDNLSMREIIKDMTGDMSEALEEHRLAYIDASVTAWGFTCIFACRETLKTLGLKNTNVQTITTPFS